MFMSITTSPNTPEEITDQYSQMHINDLDNDGLENEIAIKNYQQNEDNG